MEVVGHKARAHARYSASGAHRWFACPGSVRATDGVVEAPSAYAEEGTQAHELMEAQLRREFGSGGAYKDGPEDMRSAVQDAVNYVGDILLDDLDAIMLLEHKFEIPSAVAPGEVFGTNDICIFVPALRLLYVIDYKHGAGEYVAVEGNKQLRFYGLGALHALTGWTGARCKICNGTGESNETRSCSFCAGTGEEHRGESEIDTVALVIIQPRIDWAPPIREEWVSADEIRAFGAEIDAAIIAAQAPDAPLVPGEIQCKWCPVKTTCPAREKLALSLIPNAFGDVRRFDATTLPAVAELPLDRLGYIMAIRPQVKAWLEDVAAEAARRLQAGVKVPGQKLVEAQGRRAWDGEPAAVAAGLADVSGLPPSAFLVQKVLGIGDAEDKVLAAVRERVKGAGGKRADIKTAVEDANTAMAFLTTKASSGNLVVVPEGDPRPAVDKAAAAFAGVVQLPHIQTERQQT